MNRGLVRNLMLLWAYAAYFPFIVSTYVTIWLDRKIRFPLSFPRDVDALAKKEQWCLRQLKESGALPADAEAHEYKVAPLNQAMVFRSNAGVVEVSYTSQGERKTLKCFAKFAPTMGSVWNRTIFNLQLNHIKEIYFNRYFIPADNIAAPKPYCAEVSIITGNLCLITEHMGNCMEYGENENFLPGHIELALDGLASLHARYWKDTSQRMKKIFPIADATVDLFDSFVAFTWSIPARKVLVKSWRLMNKPETVLHGDARIGNMMFPSAEGKGRFVFIDWQAVRKGKAVFDLAYFLVLSLTASQRAASEKKYVDIYYSRLQAKGVTDYTREEMEEDYRHACLCLMVLLSLPMLSGEASVEGDAALLFVYGMNIWRERLQARFTEFDYRWMADRYGITMQEGRDAIAEMLAVIEGRLKGIVEKKQV